MLRTCWSVIVLAAWLGTATAHAVAAGECSCPGDCNRDGRVTVNELITLSGIALGNLAAHACECPCGCGPMCHSDETVCIHPAVVLPFGAVYYALYGCPQ
jgi:hypothetical protein